MEADFEYADQVTEYGEAVDSPHLYFITIIDLNEKLIRVGYTSYEISIRQLIDNYFEVTSCRPFLQRPCFKIIQHGPHFGQLALQTNRLVSYSLSLDLPCFKVYEDDHQMQLERTNSKIKASNIQATVPVTLLIQAFQIPFQIRMNQSLRQLKQRMVNKIDVLKGQPLSRLHLMKDGLFIIDETALMSQYGITKGMEIRVNIMKKHGCFSKDAKVLTKDGKQIEISKLKVGDEVISYNQQNKSLEIDKVTYVKQDYLDFVSIITLDDGTCIQTTPNHLFLCEDEIYRSIDSEKSQQKGLEVGTRLKLFNKIANISSIQQKIYRQPQLFYHLSIEKNHNFIVNGAIAHNLFLNIIIPNGDSQKVNIEPNQPFSKVKEFFEQNYEIQMHSQRLFFAGKEIQNHQSMADRNIPKESNIYLKYKPEDQFNLLDPSTPILMQNNQQRPIREIKEEEGIATWDLYQRARLEAGDFVGTIIRKTVKEKIIINLENYEQEIVTCPDCYLQLENGEAMNVRDICYNYDHGTWPRLRKIDGTTYRIKEIAHDFLPKPTEYFKIIPTNGQSYIAKDLIIHNLVINVVVIKGKKRVAKLTFGAKYTDQIIFLKNLIAVRMQIDVSDLQLTFNNQKLQNQALIIDYGIKSQNIVTANSIQKVSKSSLHISSIRQPSHSKINLIIQLSQNQENHIDFEQNKHKTVEEIMREMLPNYESSYFFIFAELIIYPNEKLSKIKNSQQLQPGDNTIIVVKNEKLAFIQNMNIQAEDVRNQSFILLPRQNQDLQNSVSSIQVERGVQMQNIFAAASNRIRNDATINTDFKGQQFYLPFLYYTSKKYHEKISKYIKKFDKYKHELNDNTSVYSIIKDLYINMNMLPHFLNKCYYGMKNFRFSKFYKPQNTFYWHNFVIAYKQEDKVKKDVSQHNGTLFVISSLKGKEIHQFSVDPARKQVLFAPFTYYMVEKIEVFETYDRVELSQISSPITFQKNIVLWVDDQPGNNIKVIKEILKTNDIEILQVTSTILAEKWVKQFGWLLNWKGLQFKLISDMHRKENGVERPHAGVDLLERLYKVHGISAETLIYCGIRANAENAIRDRQIPREKYFSIAVQEPEVKNFCKFKNK